MRKFLRIIAIILASVTLVYCGYNFVKIVWNYKQSDDEYKDLRNKYAHTASSSGTAPVAQTPGKENFIEDAPAPLEIDWGQLQAANPDIVGWIYVDAEPSISYPIVQAENNSYYLHRTYLGKRLYAGSIFEDCVNSRDFHDAQTIVYGHNMKSGSMFARLKYLLDQETYDKNPYFWILTPKGNYRYHIYSAFTTSASSAVYNIYTKMDDGYFEWMKEMKNASQVQNNVPIDQNYQSVVLSTCKGSGTSYRNVVIGRICSSARPAGGH